MDTQSYKENINDLRAKISKEKGLVHVLAIVIVFLSISLIAISGNDRVILQPIASADKELWLSKKEVSADYLEQVTEALVTYSFSFTPDTARYRFDKLLSVTNPSHYGNFQTRLQELHGWVKHNNASSVFYPHSYKVDTANFKVAVTGLLKNYIGNKESVSKQVSFLFEYSYDNYNLSLIGFRETTGANVFDLKQN